MKLTILLIFVINLGTFASGRAQQITISANNLPIKEAIKEIGKQTNYRFLYNEDLLATLKPVTLNVEHAKLADVLHQLFLDTFLSFHIRNGTITIYSDSNRKPTTTQKDIEIKGEVKDSTGLLGGVSVLIKGIPGRGTVTDGDGRYTLIVPVGSTLIFRYLGYMEQEIPVGNQHIINVQLYADQSNLEEVVVVGFGQQKRENLTGSVATVGSKQLENRPVTSVGNALQGTMAGVAVTAANSGQPGRDAATIRVRGIGTLNNSSAMVVVDGIISTMNNVNPEDISSISVLKDAASAAIYGSRAANGVILITTKKGKQGKSQISYSTYVGKQKPNGLYDYLPSWQAANLYNQALGNEGKPARYTDAEIQKFKDGSDPYNYPNTDWIDLAYQGNGIQQNHYLGVNGGNDKTQYMLSLGYYDQNGFIEKTNAKRYTSRMNLQSQLNKRLSVSGNFAYTFSPLQEPQSSYPGVPDFNQVIRQINRISPTIPYKYENGEYGSISDGNPLAWIESPSLNRENYYDFVGNVGADLEIIKGLHFKPTVAYVTSIAQDKKFIADIQYYNALGDKSFYQGPNNLTDKNTTLRRTTLQGLVTYDKSFEGHNFKLLGGYFQELTQYTENTAYRKGFLNNELSEINLGSTEGQVATGYGYEMALRSYFGRLNYDYNGKYLFEANIRYDATSRFSPDNRWGAFPSFSAGWNLDKEDFFEPLHIAVTTLKLRGSWGKLGNQEVKANSSFPSFPYYPYISVISSEQNYTFGGTSPGIATGVAPTTGANADLKWENTTTSGAGLDASFLSGKLSLTADWFNRKTNNILLDVPVSAVYGLSAPVKNAGAVSNKGWEFVLGYNDKKGDFTYQGSFNVSFINNKITDLYGTGPYISGITIQNEGLPINSLYGYIADGIFQSQQQIDAHAYQSDRTAPGDIIYRDINNDKVIDSDDKQYIGNYYPKTTFGLTLSGSFKHFDLSLFFQGAAGVNNYMEGKLGTVSDGGGKPTSALLDSWTPENTGASLPRILYAYTQNNAVTTPSSFWVKNGSYLRLKNLQIGYSFDNLVKKMGISKLRIYYSGQNILTFSGLYNWIDPEAPYNSGIYYYPQVKVNTIGLNVTF